ncbi:Eco29kI family restriction endonuclease [Microbispora triticiradicis]|uniref:Eco29kI family restriction endonuclease n=1 Tax=Microbispora triticiradicis TaxID=2200763 RepID=UPI001AD6187F|nr:Eco29kI family restriction endonuclease [Microbispora triticiradicis]MBO4269093.1 Eco29kI family restriction endonuclease [Microbispora triticiradicis]
MAATEPMLPFASAVEGVSTSPEGLLANQKFNPLGLDMLSQNLRVAMDSRPRFPLADLPKFVGAGLYALYYIGDFPLYEGLRDRDIPIYVGKAEAGNSSYGDAPDDSKPKLYERIVDKHAGSIAEASVSEGGNLRVEDFEVRYLLLDDVWIVLGERALLRAYSPVIWNTLMPGFGANPPGSARRNARSVWDTIHPGRPRAGEVCNRRYTRSEMEERVKRGIEISLLAPGADRDAALKVLRDAKADMIWSPPKKGEKDKRLRVFRASAFIEENEALGSEIDTSEWVDAYGDASAAEPDPEEAAENNVLVAEFGEAP